jgi:hypothetical protein
MNDFNTKLYRKAVFNVESINAGSDLLWIIILKLRVWITTKWSRQEIVIEYDNGIWTKFKYGYKFFSSDENRSVQLESRAFQPDVNENPICWACAK